MTNIFVGNLSFATTQDDLLSVFSAYGAVDRVNIITDRDTGQARGFAFVEMPNSNEAQAAIAALNGKESRPKPHGPRGGGRPDFKRGGGGGGGNRRRGF